MAALSGDYAFADSPDNLPSCAALPQYGATSPDAESPADGGAVDSK